jgi:superfamily II DNA helicase RecQ
MNCLDIKFFFFLLCCKAGRAGRDGQQAEAILLYSFKNKGRVSFIINMDGDDGRKKNPE